MISSVPHSLARDEWNIGIVHQSIEDIVRFGLTERVDWFPPNPWRIFADPFCLMNEAGDVVIYAERLNHWFGRGEIWAARVRAGENPRSAEFQPHIAAPVHLSYPFLVRDGETTFAIMESYEAGGLFLWRVEDGIWRYQQTLLGRLAIDSTLYRDERYWWLFCTFQDDHPNEHLYAFFSERLSGPWKPHLRNPIKTDRSSARPAGALFRVDGKLYRPSQNCARTYGGSLMLNQVLTLTTRDFEETPHRELLPQSPDYPDGIHTISAAGDYTVIDGKRWHFGVAANLARKVLARANRIRRRRRASLFPSTLGFRKIS